jgi:hypothetical protein
MNKTILPKISLGYQQITTLTAAVGLTVPSGTTMVEVQPETQSIRWRDDGTNPTASVGMVLAAGASHVFYGSFESLKFIETTATAKLNVTYYGE